MTWRERMQPASFRGVQFAVADNARNGSRRVSVRRLAGKDGSVQQDTGENERMFQVNAFVFGDNFDVIRQQLEDALLQKGPGPLVLPTRGELWVSVVGTVVSGERQGEMGFATISFTVVLEDRESKIRATKDTAGLLKKAAALLQAAATVDFASSFSILAMPGKYITQCANVITNVTNNLRVIQGKISGTLNPLEDVSASIDNLDATATGLMNTPEALGTKLADVVTSVFALADTTKDSIDRTTGLSTLSESPFVAGESVRTTRQVAKVLQGLGSDQPADATGALATQNASNVRALNRLVRVSALARQSETYADAPFDSATIALQIMRELMAEIDALQLYSATDDLFAALADQRATLATHLTQTAAQLPLVIAYVPKQETPALLLAHMLYGDARREFEIVARNQPQFPQFLSGPLEVLDS